MKTQRGIYLNIEESDYKYKDEYTNLTFYFSSMFYLHKFVSSYEEYIKEQIIKLSVMYQLDITSLFIYKYLIKSYYKRIEKRGYRIEESIYTEEVNSK